jgi:P27 family predicted phage terminase small subunit
MNSREPLPKSLRPDRPSWLDDVARAEWDRVVPELERLGLLTVLDGAALASYCAAYSAMVKAFEGLAASGVVNLGRVGDTESPYLRAAKTAFAMVRAGIQSFGLSPSDRCRLVAPGEADAEDPMESLLSATTPRITDLRALVEGKRGRDGDGK